MEKAEQLLEEGEEYIFFTFKIIIPDFASIFLFYLNQFNILLVEYPNFSPISYIYN